MSYWSAVTRNLIMQNSGPVRQQGGDLGMTTWAYVLGKDGVKTIEPAVRFYLNPPPNSRCRWSTDHGRFPPNHVVISNDGSEDGMPPRELVDWSDDIIQSKVEHYRLQYWEDLKYLVRPNTFEDLYELFDGATLWRNGAYNMWKLVNALVTLAHDQFPYILQDWKISLEKVVYEVFRPVAGSHLVRQNNNMQVLHNQHVLTEWDRTVDPLVLLQHTSFPIGGLSAMNVQQHGLLRELLICEHIRLTGTNSPIPQYYNYPRPVAHTAPTPAPESIDNQLQCAPVHSATQPPPNDTVLQTTPVNICGQKPKSAMPLVVMGTNDYNGQLKTQPRDTRTLSKDQASSCAVTQFPSPSSTSSALLPSIPEESASNKNGEVIHKGATEEATSLVDSPAAATPNAPTTKIDAAEVEPANPKITTKGATPPPDSPIRDRKDSNGSTDELFFPGAPSDKLQVVRQRSVASAPDQDTGSMLTMAEKNALTVSETPPTAQAQCDQQRYSSHPSSGASVTNTPTSQGSLRFPVTGRNQRRQQSGPIGYHLQPMPPHSRHTGQSSPHSLQMVPPFAPPNVVLRGPASFKQNPPSMHPDSNSRSNPIPSSMSAGPSAFNPHCDLAPPASASMSMAPGLPIMPPLQHHTSPYMNQLPGPHGPLMETSLHFMDRKSQNLPGHQPDGYCHLPRKYSSHAEYGDNGYSNNGYRNSNNNGGLNSQYNVKRRDSVRSTGSRNNRMQVIPMPNQPSVGFQGRRLSKAGRPDQNRGRAALSNCKNATIGLTRDELFETKFAECSCVRCEESSRSVFIRMQAHDIKLDSDLLQDALLRHFAPFNPVGVQIKAMVNKMQSGSRRTACLVEFQDGADIARIIQWSCDPRNQTLPGLTHRMHIWYPLYSKHYLPQQRYGTQDRYQAHSPVQHGRRDLNTHRNQQPVDAVSTQNGYNGSGSLPRSYPPPHGSVYQQVQPHNERRALYNPSTPQRREPKLQNSQPNTFSSDQKVITKLGYSQDVRHSRLPQGGSWRQQQPHSTSEDALANKENGKVNLVDATPDVSMVSNVAYSLPTEDHSALGAVLLDCSRDGSPGVNTKLQDTTQANKHPKEQHSKDKSGKNKLRCDASEHMPTDSRKTTDKNGDTGVAGSRAARPATIQPSQRGSVSAHGVEIGDKNVTKSNSTTLEITNPVQQNSKSVDKLKVIDENDQESINSSRTMTPEAARPSESETTTRNKPCHPKDDAVVREKQAYHDQPIAGLVSLPETVEQDTTKNKTLTSGYSMTTDQLSSAVEDVGYSTETVIRHKPGRPTIPRQWADGETDDDEAYTVTQSPLDAVQTGSKFLNRIKDVDRHMTGYHIQVIKSISTEATAQNVMIWDTENANGDTQLASESTILGAASLPEQADMPNKGLADSDTVSKVATQQNAKLASSQKHKNKNKKKKAQGKSSHLTMRSETPTEVQSRGPSPAFDQPLCDAVVSNTSSRGLSSSLQDNDEAPSESALLPTRANNKPAKNKWKRKLPVSEVSDEIAKSSGVQEDKKQSGGVDSSSQKIEASQDKPVDKSAPQSTRTDSDPKSLPTDSPSRNVEFRSDTTAGSLRMPKNRSPKKRVQKKALQSTIKNQAPSMSEATSIVSVSVPPAKEDGDVHAEASLSADQTFNTNGHKNPITSEMSFEKADFHLSNFKITKSNDVRVALPKVALALPQVVRSAKASGDWASIAKRAVSCNPYADKKDDSDPFAADKEQMTLGDFIKDRNVRSPGKPREVNEKNDVSRDKPPPNLSPEKKSCRPDTTSKSQLNAAVQAFNPSASCTSSAPSAKPRLNPNAAAFSLSSSPSLSVASALVPRIGRMSTNPEVVNTKENEKPVAAQSQIPLVERKFIKKGHAKKPSLPGHTTDADKRFVTPAEQILDSKKVVQPPPPSKDSKRPVPIPDRSSTFTRGARSMINSRQKSNNGVVTNEPTQEAANANSAGQAKDINIVSKIPAQATGDVSAGSQSSYAMASPETRSDSDLTTLHTDLFPTLDQAAAVVTTKKKRTASTAKASLLVAATIGNSGPVIGRDDNGSTQTSGTNQPQQDGTRNPRTHAPKCSAPAGAQVPQTNVAQKQTDTQGDEPKQPSDKNSWQTVAPKQKNSGGNNKGHGSRASKYGGLRNTRGGRGGRGGHDGATEERKGG